jgi:hypothetical protein
LIAITANRAQIRFLKKTRRFLGGRDNAQGDHDQLRSCRRAVPLKRSLEQGNVVLVLGAGASAASQNRKRENVKSGLALARYLAQEAGFEYAGETLQVVLSAARPVLGDQRLLRVYTEEFRDIIPADDIRRISNYTWRRLYTWNIDDALDHGLNNKVQRLNRFNGMIDSVVDSDDISTLQVIKLHGDIINPVHGFIMTEAECSSALSGGKHHWYRRAAQDYLSFTPVFIGSSLSEPILFAEIERAKRSPNEEGGRGFVITPDMLTPIQMSALKTKGLVHVPGTLASFLDWVASVLPSGNTPRNVISRTHSFSIDYLEKKVSNSDLEAVSALYPRDMDRIYARAISLRAPEKNNEARRFLRGFPPTWELAASDVPVWLTPSNGLYERISKAVTDRERMFIVTGQAGSGKSTAVMQCLVRYGREHKGVPIYELTSEVRSVRSALGVLQRLHDHPVIIYISDVFVFGDDLADDLKSFQRGKFIVIATARKGEWNEHLERRFGDISAKVEYSRFTRNDYQPLIDRLLQYVPAPAFKALSEPERLRRLSQSNEQLLIALREATYSQNFNDIITNEYEKLPDDDARKLLIIVGLATAARVGIDPGSAREAYKSVAHARSFDAAESALEGIVSLLGSGRIFARHELYIRHIIDNVVDIEMLLQCFSSISSVFTKYPVPVVKNVNKVQAALFRFCWNHKFVYEQCYRRHDILAGIRLYSGFEISFQLDGHFWLQYGLYLKECGRLDDALTMLVRSIEAYPDNPFAVHALAELQFLVALKIPMSDSRLNDLVSSAVKLLEGLDAREDEIDQYPLVTLANLHVGVLIYIGKDDEAKRFAKIYFDRLKQMEKNISSERVTAAKERVFRYAVLGEWDSRSPNGVPKRRGARPSGERNA